MPQITAEVVVSGQYGGSNLRIRLDQSIVELPSDFDAEKATTDQLATLSAVIRDRLMDLEVEINRQLTVHKRSASEREDNELARRAREKAAAAASVDFGA